MEDKEINFDVNNISYNFKLKEKKNNDKIIIFFNGALETKKVIESNKLFAFQRSSYNFNFTSIHVNDPTISFFDLKRDDIIEKTNNNLIGWYVGTNEHNVFDNLSEFLLQIISNLSCVRKSKTKIILFSSSAGCICNIKISNFLSSKGYIVHSINNNPQINLLKFHEPYVSNFLEIYYNSKNNIDFNEINDNDKEKFDIVRFLKKNFNIKKMFKIYFYVNCKDKDCIENHISYFLNNLSDLYLCKDRENNEVVKFNFYLNKMGHNGILYEKDLNILFNSI